MTDTVEDYDDNVPNDAGPTQLPVLMLTFPTPEISNAPMFMPPDHHDSPCILESNDPVDRASAIMDPSPSVVSHGGWSRENTDSVRGKQGLGISGFVRFSEHRRLKRASKIKSRDFAYESGGDVDEVGVLGPRSGDDDGESKVSPRVSEGNPRHKFHSSWSIGRAKLAVKTSISKTARVIPSWKEKATSFLSLHTGRKHKDKRKSQVNVDSSFQGAAGGCIDLGNAGRRQAPGSNLDSAAGRVHCLGSSIELPASDAKDRHASASCFIETGLGVSS